MISKMLDGQTKMVTNEVHNQNVTAVAKATTSNATSAANLSSVVAADQSTTVQTQNSSRTQDDAMVSYVFQRQNDSEYANYSSKPQRWFGTDASGNLIDVRHIKKAMTISRLLTFEFFNRIITNKPTRKNWKLVSILLL